MRVVRLADGRIGLSHPHGYWILSKRKAAELAIALLKAVRW